MHRTQQPNEIDVYVGSMIRLRRRALGLTQAKLAAAVGITFQQIQKYEKGINRVGASRLKSLCGILQVEPDFFFRQADDFPAGITTGGTIEEGDALIAFLSTKEGLEANRAFAKVRDAKVRRLLVALAESIASQRMQGASDDLLNVDFGSLPRSGSGGKSTDDLSSNDYG